VIDRRKFLAAASLAHAILRREGTTATDGRAGVAPAVPLGRTRQHAAHEGGYLRKGNSLRACKRTKEWAGTHLIRENPRLPRGGR